VDDAMNDTLFPTPRACPHWRNPDTCEKCNPSDEYTHYDGTPPHVAGDSTSHAAAEAIRPAAGTIRARVLELIRRTPMTDDELETVTGLTHQCVSARRRELVLDDLVRDSGLRRKTRSGRAAKVWEATP
jgi:hypothetical protein